MDLWQMSQIQATRQLMEGWREAFRVRGNGKLMSWMGEESKARKGVISMWGEWKVKRHERGCVLVKRKVHAFSLKAHSTFMDDFSTFLQEEGRNFPIGWRSFEGNTMDEEKRELECGWRVGGCVGHTHQRHGNGGGRTYGRKDGPTFHLKGEF